MTDTEITERAAGILGLTEQQFGVDLYWRSPHFNIRKADFDPLYNIAHAWLLVEKIRGMPKGVKVRFEARLNGIRLEVGSSYEPPYRYLWLTPRAITVAAVEACKGGKG